MLTADEQAHFFAAIEAVKNAAQRQLATRPFPENVVHLYPQLHRQVDDLFVKASEAGRVTACHAGCSYCCHVRVEAKQTEVDYIAGQLKQLPRDALEHIIDHMRQGILRKQAIEEQAPGQRGACILLENQRCAIYAYRPAVCRKGHSLDAEQCATGAATIPQHLDLILKTEALIQGIGAAVAAAIPDGAPSASTEFADALWMALADAH
ncbi:YkgJ family cysteine cluster protein [Undibacterium sp. MH2W]|uniref:YkgJ family cysteine cluster protein n=1 Tax=Undibacterium sp. MH2W TaxID=3413044 RepID=UPI003BF3F6BA